MIRKNNNKRCFFKKELADKKNGPTLKRFLNSDTILIATITAISYLFVFLYQQGAFLYFSIPISLMVFNNPEIITSLVVVIAIFTLVLMSTYYMDGFVHLLEEIQYHYSSLIFYSNVFAFLSIILNIYLLDDWDFLIYFLIMGAVQFFFYINKRYLRKEEASKVSAIPIALLITLLFGIFIFVQSLGIISIKFKSSYKTLNTIPECVVLYFRADSVVCSPFDRVTNKVERIYRVVNLLDNPNFQLKEENLGHLSLKEISTPLPTLIPIPTETPIPTIAPIPIPTISIYP